MRSTIDKLFKHFKKEFPNTASKVIDYYVNSMSEFECRTEYGKRLSSIMKAQGINQKELAEMTGVTPISINNYITGKSGPSWYNADKIARALNVSMEEFRYLEVKEDNEC